MPRSVLLRHRGIRHARGLELTGGKQPIHRLQRGEVRGTPTPSVIKPQSAPMRRPIEKPVVADVIAHRRATMGTHAPRFSPAGYTTGGAGRVNRAQSKLW